MWGIVRLRQSPSGNQFVEVNDKTQGILTQTVAVKPGAQLNFSYYHRSRQSAGGEKLRIDFKDVASGKIIHSFTSVSNNTWKKFKTTFQATGSNVQLRIVSLNTCASLTDAGCGNLLDAVAMNYAGCECTFVPDPPAICATNDNLCTNGSTTIPAITNDGIYIATVQPNPARVSTEIALSGFEGGQVQLNVIDPQGRVLKSIPYNYAYGTKIPLDLSDLSSGLYLIRVQQETKVATTKVVKN